MNYKSQHFQTLPNNTCNRRTHHCIQALCQVKDEACRTVMTLQHSSMNPGFQSCDVASECRSSVQWRPKGKTDLALEDVHRKGCTVLPLPTPATHTITFVLQHALSITFLGLMCSHGISYHSDLSKHKKQHITNNKHNQQQMNNNKHNQQHISKYHKHRGLDKQKRRHRTSAASRMSRRAAYR